MATSASTIEAILSRLDQDGAVTARKMFGEYGLFLDGKMVALVCDDILYLKPTPAGLAYLGAHEEAPPYPGAKPCAVVPDRFQRKPGALDELLRRTCVELPTPKPKKPKAPAPKRPKAP
jgi:TfoX/Sxy family transcriptional regulator of competence genes